MIELYDCFMAPLEKRWLAEVRTRLMVHAQGRVLEIGLGTGANLKYYTPEKISTLTALDPDPPKKLQAVEKINLQTTVGHSENMPYEDSAFDTVVETLVLCSVSDLHATLAEIHRVLVPGGRFIFLDHVLPEQPIPAMAFKGFNLIWPHLAHGCNLTRTPHLLLADYGFTLLESGSMAGGIFRYGIAIR